MLLENVINHVHYWRLYVHHSFDGRAKYAEWKISRIYSFKWCVSYCTSSCVLTWFECRLGSTRVLGYQRGWFIVSSITIPLNVLVACPRFIVTKTLNWNNRCLYESSGSQGRTETTGWLVGGNWTCKQWIAWLTDRLELVRANKTLRVR